MRRFLKALLILVIGLPVIAAVGYWYLQQQIALAGLSNLQLDLTRLTLRTASFASVRFQFEQDGARHQFELQNLDVSWQWPQAFKPKLQQLTLGSGQITLNRAASPAADEQATTFRLPSQWQLPAWLPQHIALTDTRLRLPCPAGHCQLQLNGYLSYHQTGQADQSINPSDSSSDGYWQSQLVVSSDQLNSEQKLAALTIDAHYRPAPQPTLELTIQQAEQIGLSLKQQINPDSQLAITELVLALSPPTVANQAILGDWGFNLPPAWLAQFQQPVQLYSRLSWQLPADGDLSNLLNSHQLDATVIARAPDPFYLPQLGLIQGELHAQLRLQNQVVERWQLKASGILSEPELPAALADIGFRINPLHFVLNSQAVESLNLNALPLQLQLTSSGENNFNLDSDLSVNLSDSPRIDISKAQVSGATARLVLAGNAATITALQLNTGLNGHWQADNWQVSLSGDSSVQGAFQTEETSTPQFKLALNDSRFAGDKTGLTEFSTVLNVSINKLSQPALLSQNWQWQGQLSGNPGQLLVKDGKLSNDADLTLMHQLSYQSAANALLLNWQMPEIFLLAGNPLAATLSDWPALLTLNRGKLTASGEVNFNDGIFTGTSQLQLGDVGGIYDRSLFAGLYATIDAVLSSNALQLDTTDLKLNRINHGFELGPLTLSGSASMPIATPAHIKLQLQQAEIQVMQGVISANNQQLDLSQPENQLVMQLQQIDLASLLQQHPSNDLSGNGKLSGTVPLTISSKGVSISDGSIAAEAPGGRLQYRSASTSAIANTNKNMKLVFDALDNFHYTVLSSNISYNTSGKLILDLKLHGSNPAMQQGRAINLNVNLEEDLPALITSLQLTNKLNDVITQRVQQYLKQQQAAAAANGDKP